MAASFATYGGLLVIEWRADDGESSGMHHDRTWLMARMLRTPGAEGELASVARQARLWANWAHKKCGYDADAMRTIRLVHASASVASSAQRAH